MGKVIVRPTVAVSILIKYIFDIFSKMLCGHIIKHSVHVLPTIIITPIIIIFNDHFIPYPPIY